MLKLKARGVLLAILLAFVVSVTGFGTAFAQTTDPFLNTYEDPSLAPYYTEVLANGGYQVSFLISPSTGFYDPATFFSSEADAQNIARSVIDILDNPVSLSGPTSITTEVYDIYGDGSWVIFVEVELPTDGSVGSLSVQAVNSLSSDPENFANFSIIRNPARPLPSVISADVWIVKPYTTANIISTDHGLTVSYNDYPNPGGGYVDRDFPTALDATFDAETDPGVSPRAGNFVYDNVPDTGIFVDSMDIDKVTYGPTGREGWQYRVYRQYALSAPDATPDGLTEYVGIDAIELLDGDIVYWAYGTYGSSSLFPASVTPRFPVPPHVQSGQSWGIGGTGGY